MKPRMDTTQRPGGRPDQPWLMLKPRPQISTVKAIEDQAGSPRDSDTVAYGRHRRAACVSNRR